MVDERRAQITAEDPPSQFLEGKKKRKTDARVAELVYPLEAEEEEQEGEDAVRSIKACVFGKRRFSD